VTGLAGLGLIVAFLGGVVSFASPCCLPLIPAYVGYMVGTSDQVADRRKTFTHGLAFVAGFTIVFVGFWASIGAIGYLFADHVQLLRQLGGVLLIILGLQVAGVINIQALWRDTRPLAMAGGMGGSTMTLGGSTGTPGYGRSLLFGTFFAAGWSPCIGPILGAIIGLASATSSVAQGTLLLLAYAAGLAVPFLAVALGASWVSQRLQWVGRHHQAINWVTGGMLIVLGFLMVTNTLSRLATLSSPLGI
jgi:cytochrome c-type biogenesis protein